MNIQDILKQLHIPEPAQRLFVHLLEFGPSSARQIADYFDIPRPTVYDHARLLIAQGLVLEYEQDNKKFFRIEDIEKIPQLLDSRIETLQQAKVEMVQNLPALLSQVQYGSEPKIKFYSGVDGVKKVLTDMLWHEGEATFTMWPISEMIEVLGVEYFEQLNRRRIRRGISIRALWPHDKKVPLKQYPFLGIGSGHLRETRIAPKTLSWDMGYWAYADKVAFISSKKEMFGFVVQSRDFYSMMQTQFELIWSLSRPVKPEPQHTDGFLETV
jgi:sugar-specific transcriptional regulator TrmB